MTLKKEISFCLTFRHYEQSFYLSCVDLKKKKNRLSLIGLAKKKKKKKIYSVPEENYNLGCAAMASHLQVPVQQWK